SQQALAYVMAVGLSVSLPLAVAIDGTPGSWTGRSWAWAIVGGLASTGGLSMMYRALAIGKVGVVSPIASTEGALAALIAIILGEHVTAGIAAALVVVAAGVVAVTFHGRLEDIHLRPSLYAIGAASLFGVGLWSSARAGDQ